jgi:O-antigen/teichoic acid export membrane protein
MGIVSVGAFLVTRVGVFVVSLFYGLTATASYSISLQMFSVVSSISQVALITFLPRMTGCRVSGDMHEFKKLFLISIFFVWTISIFLDVNIILFGNYFLSILHSKTMLMGQTSLLLIAIVSLLETNHASCGGAIATGNTIPFLTASVLSGAAVCLLSFVIGWSRSGLIFIILAQGLVQLSYSNWKWPLMIYKELHITKADIKSIFMNGWIQLSERFIKESK